MASNSSANARSSSRSSSSVGDNFSTVANASRSSMASKADLTMASSSSDTLNFLYNHKMSFDRLCITGDTKSQEPTVPPNSVPIDDVFTFDTCINSKLVRVFLPAGHQPNTRHIVPVVIYFHGGSFMHLSADAQIYDDLCRQIVKKCKSIVVSVNYRLTPKFRWPCARDDGLEALASVHSERFFWSGEDLKSHVYLAGDSSGGNIAHHVAVEAARSNNHRVLGNILIYPMFGGEERKRSEIELDGRYFTTNEDRDRYWRAYLPDGANRDHEACNVFGPRSRSLVGLNNFPKTLVVVPGCSVTRDWQTAYAEGLRRSGHEVDTLLLRDATFGFIFFANNEFYKSMMDKMSSFIHPECG